MVLIIDIEYIKKMYREYFYEFDTSMELYSYLINNGFFEAPCSAGHHLSVDGGLAIHSYSVLRYALSLAEKYGSSTFQIPIESIIKCALLHDVHKMFLYEKVNGEWQYKKQKLSNINYKQHGQWAVDIIETFISLTKQEKEMILWHMGPYTEFYDDHKSGDFLKWSNDKKNKNINAALFLYFCDHFSSMFLED